MHGVRRHCARHRDRPSVCSHSRVHAAFVFHRGIAAASVKADTACGVNPPGRSSTCSGRSTQNNPRRRSRQQMMPACCLRRARRAAVSTCGSCSRTPANHLVAGRSIGGRHAACAALDREWFQAHAPYDTQRRAPVIDGGSRVDAVRWRSRRRRLVLLTASRSSLVPPQPHSAVHRPSYLAGQESRSGSSEKQSPT